jgi:hypothetical protein
MKNTFIKTAIIKIATTLLCLLMVLIYIKVSAQDKKEVHTKQMMLKKQSIDRRLDSIINNTVLELKKSNDTIRAKNENWQKIIDRSNKIHGK